VKVVRKWRGWVSIGKAENRLGHEIGSAMNAEILSSLSCFAVATNSDKLSDFH